MDQTELRQVPRTIRDYVIRAGGQVLVEELEADFKVAYGTPIPFKELRCNDLISFLKNIYGVEVVEEDGLQYVVTRARMKNTPTKTYDQPIDISSSFENLVIQDRSGQRKVTLKSNTEKTNTACRRTILNKMSQYSNSAKETTQGLPEPQNEPVSSNFTEYSYTYNNFDSNSSSSNGASGSPSVTSEESIVENTEDFYTPSHSSNSSSKPVSPNYSDSPHYISLLHLIMKNNLEYPIFETFTNISPTDNCISFSTVLRVGKENFISPTYNDLPTKSVYEDLLMNAYESLKKKYDVATNTCCYDVVSQLLEIINSFKTGIDTHTIETAFIKRYGTSPPANWINLIKSSSSIYVETLGTQVIVYANRLFLTRTPFSSALPPKTYPTKDTWNIQITNCVNTNMIFFRILEDDFQNRYENLVKEMRIHYSGYTVSDVRNVKPSELYACFYDGSWCRAEVIKCKEITVQCLLLDLGLKEEIPLLNLFPLNHKFTNTPPLAFRCSMAGLSKYEKVNYLKCQLHKMLSNEIAYAKVDSNVNDVLSMNIYLRNNSFNVCVNQYFLNKIKKELNPPNIKELGKIFHARVFHVKESGLAQIQIESESSRLLKHSLERAAKIIEEDRSKFCLVVSSMSFEKVYLSLIDNSWERVLARKILSDNKIEIKCIDTGEVKTVDITSMVHTDSLPDTLLHISPQVQQVKILHNDTASKKVISFMSQAFAESKRDLELFIKVVKIDEYAVVEFCRKLYNEQMVSLNDLYLSSCDQITSINFINNLSNILPSELCFDLFGNYENMANLNIPQYEMSKGETLKVTVMKTLNPSNFILKIENHVQFDELMLKLNNYNLIFAPKPIHQISLGRCYAVQLENGFWYRGLALYVMEDLKTAVIRLLDYAETVSVPITSIYPLPAEFYSLPVQTFSAQLLVKPIQGQWTGQDCYRFKEIVFQKVLECVIVDNDDTLTKVVLLDGSNKREIINISTLFVKENRAI